MKLIIKDTEKDRPYKTFDKVESVKENDASIVIFTKTNKYIFAKPEYELVICDEEVSYG